MPIVRVELPTGTPVEIKTAARNKVKAAVLETLAPKEAKYDYVAIREVHAEIGDGVPIVTVDLRPGRETARKAALAHAIAEALGEVAGIAPEDVYVLYRENPAETHYCGGQPLADWTPADA